MLSDGINDYLYDGEARICAVKSITTEAMTGYLYDGNGSRIAKGTLTSFSCNLALNGNLPSNGFALTSSYVVDKDGQQLTELQSGTPVHTNVFADGGLLATYASSQTFFSFKDWLGTKRVEIGVTCKSTYESLPYGDELNPNGNCPDATEHHFTGKEHDTESGSEYFLARYYSSNTGRFMSPDWASDPTAVPYASYADPQSVNLYAYVRNNPLTGVDADGHGCQYNGTCWIEGDIKNVQQAVAAAQSTMTGAYNRELSSVKTKALKFLGQHRTAVKVVSRSIIVGTAISGVGDAGASDALVPEEMVGEAALETEIDTEAEGAAVDTGAAEDGGAGEAGPGTAKDQSLQGRQDQLKDMEREQRDYRKGRRSRPVDRINKSRQNLGHALKQIKSLQD